MSKAVYFGGKRLPDMTPQQQETVRRWVEWTPVFIAGVREYAWIEKKLFFVHGVDGEDEPKWMYRCAICKEEHENIFLECENLECMTLREIAR